ncbi:hypothetical protein HC928_03550 [bacterium]|nr:hypothetical protein [bacterium]
MRLVHHPEHVAAGLHPLQAVLQEGQFAALLIATHVAGVGRVHPGTDEGVAAGAQLKGVALHRLDGAELRDTSRSAVVVEFVGVRRQVPRLGQVREGFAFPGAGSRSLPAPGANRLATCGR